MQLHGVTAEGLCGGLERAFWSGVQTPLYEAVPLWGRWSWVPIQHNVAWAEAYVPTKWHLDPSRHELKIGRLSPFGGGGAGSLSNTVWPGPRSTSTPAAS